MGKRHGRRGPGDCEVAARLLHSVTRFHWHRRRQHGKILNSLHQSRVADVVLLHSVIRAQSEKSCALSIIRQAPDPFNRGNRLAGDMFGPDIPHPCLTKFRQHAFRSSKLRRKKNSAGSQAYPSENCRILPFFDHANQLRPDSTLSLLFKIRMVFGDSAVGGLETLHTRKSPSDVCVANISDFCLVDDACHARFTIGEGARGVVKVCKMVKAGCRATIKIEPFRYLRPHQHRYVSATPLSTDPIAYV